MISERVLARSFSGFWTELLPLLTPSFVHMFNEVYRNVLIDERGGDYGEPVEKATDVGDSAFIAEVAFYLAKLATQRATSVIAACEDTALVSSAVHLASATVAAYESDARELHSALTDGEHHEVLSLAQNYDLFFRIRSEGKPIVFNPRIPGAGFIASCEADIAIADTIYEVKTITRNIASKDIRQLLIYLALQAATGERLWIKAGFFNPRRAILHEFYVDDLISRMSGGRFAVEVFRDVIAFSLSRDLEVDAAF